MAGGGQADCGGLGLCNCNLGTSQAGTLERMCNMSLAYEWRIPVIFRILDAEINHIINHPSFYWRAEIISERQGSTTWELKGRLWERLGTLDILERSEKISVLKFSGLGFKGGDSDEEYQERKNILDALETFIIASIKRNLLSENLEGETPPQKKQDPKPIRRYPKNMLRDANLWESMKPLHDGNPNLHYTDEGLLEIKKHLQNDLCLGEYRDHYHNKTISRIWTAGKAGKILSVFDTEAKIKKMEKMKDKKKKVKTK
jgi:hypothetical protein